jgi:hypothetical protein
MLTIHANAALFVNNLAALPKIFVVLALCPKSLRFSCCIQKPCSSCAFSISFTFCSKSLHFSQIFLLPDSPSFSKRPSAFIKILTLSQITHYLAKNMCRKGLQKFMTKLPA